jgi:hypothetical protein
MTITFTVAPVFPVLSAALCLAALVSGTRSTCLLAVFAFTWRTELFGRVCGWQAVTFGLLSATLFSVELWQAGALFGVTAAGCGLLWRRERKHGDTGAAL